MAKEDFCFTYYDGDAARDMAHMNRLERGGYADIIVSQRKFGHLSMALIKKTLGSDFDSIWEALEIILKTDGDGNYYIEWLEKSIEKMRNQSVKQMANGKLGGRPKANKNPNENQHITQTVTQEKPLEDGNGDECIGCMDGGAGETNRVALLPTMLKQFTDANQHYPVDTVLDLPSMRIIAGKIHKWLCLPGQVTDDANREAITRRWGEMIAYVKSDQHLSGYDISKINKYFQTIAQGLFGKHGTTTNQHRDSKPGGKQTGRNQLLESLRADVDPGGK